MHIAVKATLKSKQNHSFVHMARPLRVSLVQIEQTDASVAKQIHSFAVTQAQQFSIPQGQRLQ